MSTIKLAASNPDIGGGGPRGPENSMLEQRVEKLEQRAEHSEGSLQRIELIATELKERTSHPASAADVAEIKGRLNSIPTTWQTVAILATLLIGIAGLVVATNNFLAHSGKPDAPTTQATK
jgi:hypothetical protein